MCLKILKTHLPIGFDPVTTLAVEHKSLKLPFSKRVFVSNYDGNENSIPFNSNCNDDMVI